MRGRRDPVDYFLNQQCARYRCTYPEHSYDNDTTRLIARTLEHLDSHAFLREAHVINQTFQIATSGQRSTIQDLLAMPPVRNRYYADYNKNNVSPIKKKTAEPLWASRSVSYLKWPFTNYRLDVLLIAVIKS